MLLASSTALSSTFWLGAGIAATAGILVFLDARKRGNANALAWGAGVFLMLALALPLYIFRVRRNNLSDRQKTPVGEPLGETGLDFRAALNRMQRAQPFRARGLRLVGFLVLIVLMGYWKTPIWLEVPALAVLAGWFTRNDLRARQQKR